MLSSITDINKITTTYGYSDSLNRITNISKGNGLENIKISYDDTTHSKTVENLESNSKVTTTYNILGEPTKISTTVDEKPRTTTINYTNTGNSLISKTQNGDGTGQTIELSGSGKPLQTQTAGGITTTYNYSNGGLTVTEIKQPYGTFDIQRTSTLKTDILGRPITETDANQNTTTYEYNTPGKTLTINQPENKTTIQHYDKYGRLLDTEINGQLFQKITYHDSLRQLSITNRLGGTKTIKTDLLGRTVKEKLDDGSVEAITTYLYSGLTVTQTTPSIVKTTTYDSLYRPSVVVNGNQTTTFTYENNKGKLITTITTGSKITELQYNSIGELLNVKENGVLKKNVQYHYANRETIETELADTKSQRIIRKDLNNRVYEINNNGELTQIVRNNIGNPIKTITPYYSSECQYDGNGNKTYEKRGVLNEKYFNYDGLNRLILEQYPLGWQKTYSYNIFDEITQTSIHPGTTHHKTRRKNKGGDNLTLTITSLSPNIKQWVIGEQNITISLDGLGRTTKIGTNGNKTRLFQYDLSGNIKAIKDFDGINKSYEYYPDTGLLKIEQVGNSQREYTYDEQNRLTSVTTKIEGRAPVTGRLTYDVTGKIKTRIFENGKQITYEYYPNGKLRSITDNLGGKTIYSYSKKGNISEIKNSGNILYKTYEYDNQTGLLKFETNYEQGQISTKTAYSYNPSGLIKSQTTTNINGEILLEDQYAYDEEGNIVEKKEKRGAKTFTKLFTYAQGKLTTVEIKANNEVIEKVIYQYDNAGNRIKEIHEGAEEKTIENTFNEMNQLISSQIKSDSSSLITHTYTYDQTGRLIEENIQSGDVEENTTTYTYNDFGNLQAVSKGMNTATYSYSFDNKRITSTINGSVYNYTYHGNELFETYISNGQRIEKNIVSPNGIVGQEKNNTYQTLITDIQNSVIGTVQSQLLTQSYSYEPYGITHYEQNINNPTSVQWLCRTKDEITGAYNLVNRTYSPKTGRFDQQDYFGYLNPRNPNSLNLYQYGNNNPNQYEDPNGKTPYRTIYDTEGTSYQVDETIYRAIYNHINRKGKPYTVNISIIDREGNTKLNPIKIPSDRMTSFEEASNYFESEYIRYNGKVRAWSISETTDFLSNISLGITSGIFSGYGASSLLSRYPQILLGLGGYQGYETLKGVSTRSENGQPLGLALFNSISANTGISQLYTLLTDQDFETGARLYQSAGSKGFQIGFISGMTYGGFLHATKAMNFNRELITSYEQISNREYVLNAITESRSIRAIRIKKNGWSRYVTRERVLGNIARSKQGRFSSNFRNYARKDVAFNYYLETGWETSRIYEHLNGIDFSQNVRVVEIEKNSIFFQWRSPDRPIGNYFSSSIIEPTRLGIYGGNKLLFRYRLRMFVRMLESTAAPVEDFWSIPGRRFQTEGGGIQYFLNSNEPNYYMMGNR